MRMTSLELRIESFLHRRGDPIPDISHHTEEIRRAFGQQIDYTSILFDVRRQIESGTRDEMLVFHYVLARRHFHVYSSP